jgi:uncharacterized membrane protein (UPF0127 family)
MRALLLLVGVTNAFVAADCQRAPPEDFAWYALPAASTARSEDAGSARTTALQGASDHEVVEDARPRCFRPTPAEAPRPAAPGPAVGCPPDPLAVPTKLPIRQIAFLDSSGHELAGIAAELAVSPDDTQRGLMYRKSMATNHGMLFDLGTRSDHQFWMHNTCIPLDLVFVDDDGFIVGIVENAPTLDDSSRGVGCASRYVIEVNAGWARSHGVKAGQHVRIP